MTDTGSRRLTLLIAAAICASTLAPTAYADSPDDTFVNALTSQGITGDRGAETAAGRAVCDNVSRSATSMPGYTHWAALGAITPLNLPPNQWPFVISAAEAAYCPQYLALK